MVEFDINQKEAIAHYNGPMMVIAGPGSGKTTVITHRIKYLIENYNVNPGSILVITYTRAAAAEMSDRFTVLIKSKSKVTFGTFHSVFYSILRLAYNYKNEDIITEYEKYELLKKIIANHNFNYETQDDFLKNLISDIGLCKCDRCMSMDFNSSCLNSEDFNTIYNEYTKSLEEAHKIDFEDMLVYTYELFMQRPDILLKCQKLYRYILVDEFQDINKIQYEIVKLLVGDNRNLFVVGDDDQSVYSFRGATPNIMQDIRNDFPDIKIVYLSTNYRCSSDIVCCANRIIKNNNNRYSKNIVSAYSGVQRERVHVITVKDQKEEYKDIISRICDMNKQGIQYSDIAILHRTNVEARALATKLIEYNIPIKINDSVSNIFTHFIARNIIDYIMLALGDRSRKRFISIVNRPNRYIERDAFWGNEVSFDELREYYKDNIRIQNNINVLQNDLKRISVMKPYGGINYIRKACGYDTYIKEYAKYRGLDWSDYYSILDDVLESSREFNSYNEWFDYIEEYTRTLNDLGRRKLIDKNSVTISTMHSAKGLEFDQVFILNAVEGFVPHKKSKEIDEIEEERRIFYVAVTRARYGLYVYVPEVLYGRKSIKSRFVCEMIFDEDLFQVGNRIVHKRYGNGTIVFVDNKKVIIDFESGITKTLSIEYSINNSLIASAMND